MFKSLFFLINLLLLYMGLIVFNISCSNTVMDEKEAQKVLNDFYNDNVPESIIDRQLLSAGRAIVPHLITKIQQKDMKRRRYAIGALGKLGDRRALPTLEKLLKDDSEMFYFRHDALIAIWHIDRNYGGELAKKYCGKIEDIDRTIQLLKENKL